MNFEVSREVGRVVSWVRDHPGLSTKDLVETIRKLPFEQRDNVPSSVGMMWKLRYVEQLGHIQNLSTHETKTKWYVTD